MPPLNAQQVRHHQEACLLYTRGEGCARSTTQRRRPRLEGGQFNRIDAIMIGPLEVENVPTSIHDRDCGLATYFAPAALLAAAILIASSSVSAGFIRTRCLLRAEATIAS